MVKTTKHVKDEGCNMCCDNSFALLLLVEKLQQAKLSSFGTIDEGLEATFCRSRSQS